MPLGMEVGLIPGDFVFDPAPIPKGAKPTQFSAHVYCGQTAAWIKMSLGTELGLGASDIVLDWDPAPTGRKGTARQFSAHVCYGQRVAHLSNC